jgi:uncharacterized protein YceH (UPF0502 family)
VAQRDPSTQAVPPELDTVEVRVLGSLLEKEIATPEYYPLTLNALVNACNQKSNRYPETSYDEATVRDAIQRLRAKALAIETTGAGHRVPKYSQRLTEALNLGRREQALLCELMVRGPQTLGELRSRAERMHAFSDLEEVEATLRRLAEFEGRPLVTELPRQPGTKENRFAQLLSGDVHVEAARMPAAVEGGGTGETRAPSLERLSALEEQLQQLRRELDHLKQQFVEFRRQLE